jgi:hypothetical protein
MIIRFDVLFFEPKCPDCSTTFVVDNSTYKRHSHGYPHMGGSDIILTSLGRSHEATQHSTTISATQEP